MYYSTSNETICQVVPASLSTTVVSGSDSTYWLFNLNMAPSGAPDHISVCWSDKYCGESGYKQPMGNGDKSTQYQVLENRYNTNSTGSPLAVASATAIISGQSSVSNFVLGAIPGESYCDTATGEDANEQPTATDTNGSCAAPPTTAAPTTTVASTTTAAPATTSPPVTAPSVAPTTTLPPTTTTRAPVVAVPVTQASAPPSTLAPTTTTLPPTTTTSPPTTEPVSAPAVIDPLTISTHQAPPGTTITVQGGHFGASCTSVVVALGNRVLLHSGLTAAHSLAPHSLYIPGDTQTGDYPLTVRCATGNDTQLGQAIVFSVVPQSIHRSGFATSLLLPSQINFGIKAVAGSLALAGASIPLVAFPAEFINAALEDHEAEIHRWTQKVREKLHRRQRIVPEGVDWRAHATLMVVLLATALLYGFLDPRFGFDMTSLALYAGLLFGLVVITLVADVPAIMYLKEKTPGVKLSAHAIPGALLVALICVVLSRALHFEPGYLYGTVAGLRVADRHDLEPNEAGRSSALSGATAIVLSILAWLAREPLISYANSVHAPFLAIAADAALVAVFVAGVQGVLLNMLPLRFLPGHYVFEWSRKVWFGIIIVAFFAFVHLLLGRGSGYVGSTSSMWPAVAFIVTVALLTAAVWLFFMRYDKKHPRMREESEEEIIGI